MYSELINEFQSLAVVDFDSEDDWRGPDTAYRLRSEYDDEKSVEDRLRSLLSCAGSERLSALIIGAWTGACEGDDAAGIVATLSGVASQLPGLRSLFLGEMTVEECEISWINQTDITPLLNAYPALESLRIRGGEGLSFTRTDHANLRELAIETGGLSRDVIRQIFLCSFPALEHLELLLGESNYGFDATIEDFQPLLAGDLYPKLRFLGLMNCEIADDIAAVVVNSPVVDRIEMLDLSMGNLGDAGVRSLCELAGKINLKSVNISHFYADESLVDQLRNSLSCEVIAMEKQEPDDDWRPVLHAE